MAYLEIKKGKAVLQSALDEEAMSIGRLPGNSIVVNDPDISRRHCVVERWEGRYSVYDLGSRNGTKLNGERIQRADLKHGDTITIGKTIVKFLEAPLSTPVASHPVKRAAPRWALPVVAVIGGAVVVAWATGVFGGATPDNIRSRMGLGNRGSDSQPGDAPSQARNHTDQPSDATPHDAEQHPLQRGIDTETGMWINHYQRLPESFEREEADRLLGRACSANFIGKPVMDEDGAVLWELPPDGAVTALLEPAGIEAQRLLTVLANEPTLLEVELAGLLEKDPAQDRLRLRVGVISILPAPGGNDSLQAATRRLVNHRIVFNPLFTAQAIEEREE